MVNHDPEMINPEDSAPVTVNLVDHNPEKANPSGSPIPDGPRDNDVFELVWKYRTLIGRRPLLRRTAHAQASIKRSAQQLSVRCKTNSQLGGHRPSAP